MESVREPILLTSSEVAEEEEEEEEAEEEEEEDEDKDEENDISMRLAAMGAFGAMSNTQTTLGPISDDLEDIDDLLKEEMPPVPPVPSSTNELSSSKSPTRAHEQNCVPIAMYESKWGTSSPPLTDEVSAGVQQSVVASPKRKLSGLLVSPRDHPDLPLLKPFLWDPRYLATQSLTVVVHSTGPAQMVRTQISRVAGSSGHIATKDEAIQKAITINTIHRIDQEHDMPGKNKINASVDESLLTGRRSLKDMHGGGSDQHKTPEKETFMSATNRHTSVDTLLGQASVSLSPMIQAAGRRLKKEVFMSGVEGEHGNRGGLGGGGEGIVFEEDLVMSGMVIGTIKGTLCFVPGKLAGDTLEIVNRRERTSHLCMPRVVVSKVNELTEIGPGVAEDQNQALRTPGDRRLATSGNVLARLLDSENGEEDIRATLMSAAERASDQSETGSSSLLGHKGAYWLQKAPVHVGWLFKRGQNWKSWQKRWFIMSVHEEKLAYFKDEQTALGGMTSKHVLGVVELVGARIVDREEEAVMAAQRKHVYRFSVVTKNRELLLAAEDSASKDRWIQILRAGIAVVSSAATRDHMLQNHQQRKVKLQSNVSGGRENVLRNRPVSTGKSFRGQSNGDLGSGGTRALPIHNRQTSISMDPSWLSPMQVDAMFSSPTSAKIVSSESGTVHSPPGESNTLGRTLGRLEEEECQSKEGSDKDEDEGEKEAGGNDIYCRPVDVSLIPPPPSLPPPPMQQPPSPFSASSDFTTTSTETNQTGSYTPPAKPLPRVPSQDRSTSHDAVKRVANAPTSTTQSVSSLSSEASAPGVKTYRGKTFRERMREKRASRVHLSASTCMKSEASASAATIISNRTQVAAVNKEASLESSATSRSPLLAPSAIPGPPPLPPPPTTVPGIPSTPGSPPPLPPPPPLPNAPEDFGQGWDWDTNTEGSSDDDRPPTPPMESRPGYQPKQTKDQMHAVVGRPPTPPLDQRPSNCKRASAEKAELIPPRPARKKHSSAASTLEPPVAKPAAKSEDKPKLRSKPKAAQSRLGRPVSLVTSTLVPKVSKLHLMTSNLKGITPKALPPPPSSNKSETQVSSPKVVERKANSPEANAASVLSSDHSAPPMKSTISTPMTSPPPKSIKTLSSTTIADNSGSRASRLASSDSDCPPGIKALKSESARLKARAFSARKIPKVKVKNDNPFVLKKVGAEKNQCDNAAGVSRFKDSKLMSASDAEAVDAVMAGRSGSASWVALTCGHSRGMPKFMVAEQGKEGGFAALRKTMVPAAIVFGFTYCTVKYDHGRPANRVPLLVLSVGKEITSALKRGRATTDCTALKKEYASRCSGEIFVYRALRGEDLDEILMEKRIAAFYRGSGVVFS